MFTSYDWRIANVERRLCISSKIVTFALHCVFAIEQYNFMIYADNSIQGNLEGFTDNSRLLVSCDL